MWETILAVVRGRVRDERGASAVEYGLLLTGITALIVVVVFAFGDNVLDLFSGTCDSMNDARGSAQCDR
jgi:pilus assembly protein Flp/PilA